jgi:hypothetical protein
MLTKMFLSKCRLLVTSVHTRVRTVLLKKIVFGFLIIIILIYKVFIAVGKD